jgi:hypothetical protein
MLRPSFSRAVTAEREFVGFVVGGIGAVALAALLVTVRGEIVNANAALALVLPVFAASVIGGRWPAVSTAIIAALSFDFFFTQPYQSLKIDSHNDVETLIVFLVVALIAAEIGIRGRHTSGEAKRSKSEVERLYRVAELGARAADTGDVVLAVQAEMIGLFDLEDCDYEATASYALPKLGAKGALEDAPLRYVGRDFELPHSGVEVPVVAHGVSYGRLVLRPRAGTSATMEQRRVAIALADELGLALASTRRAG